MARRMVPILDPTEAGRRLRRLRRLAGVSLEDLAKAIGYSKGGNSSLSLIERGKRKLHDFARKKAANHLAGKGDLVRDAPVLYGYLDGGHDDLNACVDSTAADSPNPGYRKVA